MATSSGEPLAERARVDGSDAEAKLKKAEEDYAEAKKVLDEKEQKLETAFNAQHRDNDLIRFLEKSVESAAKSRESAEKDKEFAQKMLLQSKSQPEEMEELRQRLKELEKHLSADTSAVRSSHGEGAQELSPDTKQLCRDTYRCCAFCGLDEGLSVAHLATKQKGFAKSPKGRRYSTDFEFDGVRNTIRLCHGFAGSCHSMLDCFRIALLPPLLDSADWAIVCLKDSGWHMQEEQTIQWSFDNKFGKITPAIRIGDLKPAYRPYRRVLAGRYRCFLKEAKEIRPYVLSRIWATAELSSRASEEEEEVEELKSQPAKR
ncbi:unnamed protein product, partial [Symbiodinium sp. CCMP2456]